MREEFTGCMVGRYGIDNYSKFLLGSAVTVMVLNLFLRIGLLNLLVLGLLAYVYVRMFSRNIQKRYQENRGYLEFKYKITSLFVKEKRRMEDRKVNHIYTCPSCKQKIRIPRGKGKICITCPKCRTEFTKKS